MNDRAWMYTGHPNQKNMTEEWLTKTEQFLEVAFSAGQPRTWCPCTRCKNYSQQTKDVMGKHLQMRGFMPDYTLWSFHGESAQRDRHEVVRQRIEDCGTGIEDMVNDYNDARHEDEEPEETAKAFYAMLESSKLPLHAHTKLCQLDAIAQTMALKAQFNLPRECYDAMMTVFGRFLPDGHIMPANLYHSDKILGALKMPIERIHACEKGCVLFRHEYADDNYCPRCKSSRYIVVDNGLGEKTQSKIPVNILRYLPILPRLQRLYMLEETAKQMTWHRDGIRRATDEYGNLMLTHPSDGEAWKMFNEIHKEGKAKDPRNVALAISLDGFNPFGMTATQYSCWPVFIMPLNLPPGVLMQRKHIFLTLIVPGPNYPGKNMNVYLQPLMDELKEAWDNGIWTYDAASKTNFQMHAWLMYSMHDLPAFALFVAWCVHGRFPCPQCKSALKFHWLPEGRKYSCFDLHRQFLPLDHGFRKDKKNFTKGKVVEHEAPPMMTGAQILDQLNSLEPDPNRPGYFLGYNTEHAWTHKPCFWDLPYFKDLALPHNIDMMHTEKNMGEALFGTLFGTDKGKDNVKARVDQESLCNRKSLNMRQPKGKKNWEKPKAWFNLKREHMREILIWVKKKLMFPDGYAANLARGASLEKLKIFGLKSHDWHIWLERIMPVMLRGYIPEDEWLVMAELSYFFRVLCAKELSPIVIEEMEKLAPELICKLEKIFPPGFFNPMQHMILHLPTEARLGGPVQNRWCYATERMQKTLRAKCKNKRRIEASMAEAFVVEEAANFVTAHYAATNYSLHNPKPRYNTGDPERHESKFKLFKGSLAPCGVMKTKTLTFEEWGIITLYILTNMTEVRPYIE